MYNLTAYIKHRLLLNKAVCDLAGVCMDEDVTDIRKRMPAAEKKISDIKAEDVRVSVLGTVIDKKDNRVVLDDGSGKINITFDEPQEIEINQFVRVFGRVIPVEDGFELQGEIAQDMSRLNMDLYRKIMELEGKA